MMKGWTVYNTHLNEQTRLKYLEQRLDLAFSLLEEMGYNIANIYNELDMVDEETPLTGYDLCDCDKHYGHMCQDSPYTTMGYVEFNA